MKRIAAHIGLTAFCALAVAFYLSENVKIIIVAICGVLAILFFLIKAMRKRIAIPVMLCVVALSFGVNLLYTAWAVKPVVDAYCGKDQSIEATLTDEEFKQYAKYYYRLTTETINGEEAHIKVLLKSDKPLDIDPFDKLSFTSDISPVDNNYYLAKGYYISVDDMELEYAIERTDTKPLYYHVIRLRQAMRDALDDFLPEQEANLCKAILLGDKYALDQEIRDDFRNSGASYYIVVSGMHFSILCMMCLWLFKRVIRKHYIYYPLTYAVIFLYMMLTGFQPSVMRSGIMMLIWITGQWVMRQTDPLTSLGIAGIAMPFIFTPYGCGDIGMILSFAATFSIIVWQAPIYTRIRIKRIGEHLLTRWCIKAVNGILQVISVCLAANILVLPLSVFLFKGFSVMTLVSSLLFYPLIPLIMGFSLVVCALYYLGPLRYLALIVSWPLYGVSKLVLWLARLLSSLPFAYVRVKSLYLYIWVAATLILFIIAYLLRKRCRLYPMIALLSAIIMTVGLSVHCVVTLNTNQLEFYAGKTGSVVYLNYCGRVHMLRFDCDSNTAYQMLKQLQNEHDGAYTATATTYAESVNYSRMSDNEFPIDHYLMYRSVNRNVNASVPDESIGGASVVMLDDGVRMNTVEHDRKLLLYLTDTDRTILLIPNGFDYEAIPQSMRKADIIFIGKSKEKYAGLSCDTLVLCSSEQQKYPLPQHQSLIKPKDKHLSLALN